MFGSGCAAVGLMKFVKVWWGRQILLNSTYPAFCSYPITAPRRPIVNAAGRYTCPTCVTRGHPIACFERAPQRMAANAERGPAWGGRPSPPTQCSITSSLRSWFSMTCIFPSLFPLALKKKRVPRTSLFHDPEIGPGLGYELKLHLPLLPARRMS